MSGSDTRGGNVASSQITVGSRVPVSYCSQMKLHSVIRTHSTCI